MLQKFDKYRRLDPRDRRLLLEAFRELALLRLALRLRPLKTLLRPLRQHHPGEEPALPVDPHTRELARAVGRAVTRAAAHTPWESACLLQALCTSRMLRRRGIPFALYLGVAKDEAIQAHAWTLCGDEILTGGAGSASFRTISVFSWEGDSATRSSESDKAET